MHWTLTEKGCYREEFKQTEESQRVWIGSSQT